MTQRELYDVYLNAYIAAARGAAHLLVPPDTTEERVAVAIGLRRGSAKDSLASLSLLNDDVWQAIERSERRQIELVDEQGVQYSLQVTGDKIPPGRYRIY